MAFTLWPTAFVAGVTQVTAAFLNQIRVDVSRALDGLNGGTYTLASLLELAGAGLKVSGPLTATSTTALQGATTADDLTMSGTERVKVASRTVTRMLPLLGFSPANNETQTAWATTLSWNIGEVVNLIEDRTAAWHVPLDLPDGQVITQILLHVQGTGHVASGGLPTNMPRFKIYAVTSAGATEITPTSPGGNPGGLDTSSNATNYDAAHTIAWIPNATMTVDRATTTYWLVLQSEGGPSHYVAGTKFHALTVTSTVTDYPEW